MSEPAAGLLLRLLPTTVTERGDALLGKQAAGQSSGAYLCTEMAAPVGDGRVRCLPWPYGQRWPRALIAEMCNEIRAARSAQSGKGTLSVVVALYHFLPEGDSREEGVCIDVLSVGTARLVAELDRGCRLVAAATSPYFAEIKAARRPDVQLRVGRMLVGSEPPQLSEVQRRCLRDTIADATLHWREQRERLQELVPPGSKCRAVVLSDTPILGRHQAAWARGQRHLGPDADGELCQLPLLAENEQALVLSLTSTGPISLRALGDCNLRGSGVEETTWNPWDEALASLQDEGTQDHGDALRKLVEVRIGKESGVGALPAGSTTICEAELHAMRHYYSRPQWFRASGAVDHKRAQAAVSNFFDQSTPLQRYRLLWFAVLVPTCSDVVERWIRAQLLLRVSRADFEPQYWAVARFWAVVARTSEHRVGSFGKTTDPINLGDLLVFMEGMAPSARAEGLWKQHLRLETLWVGHELRPRAHAKGSGCRRLPSSVWTAYGTADPLAGQPGMSLEMLQRAMLEFDVTLQHLEDTGCTWEGVVFLVSGSMARRLFVISRFAARLAVVVLGGKDAPQAGTSKKFAALTVARRLVIQLAPGTLSALAEEGGQDARRLEEQRLLVAAAVEDARVEGDPAHCRDFRDWQEWRSTSQQAGVVPVAPLWRGPPNGAEAAAAVSGILARLDEAEAAHRAKLAEPLRPRLLALWQRQHTTCLRSAACASVLGLGHPASLFLEAFLEQLSRASEEPLLRHLRGLPAWTALRTGRDGNLVYSQEMKRFVREVLAPLCVGPAATLRVLQWLGPCHTGLAAAGWHARSWLGLCKPEESRLREDDALFLDDVAPTLGLWQLEWARHRFEARPALARLRGRALLAGQLHAAGAPTWLLQAAIAQLPDAPPVLPRAPGARRSRASAAPSQLELLALLQSTDTAPRDMRALRAQLTAPEASPVDLRSVLRGLDSLGESGAPPPQPALDAAPLLEAWEQQAALSEAVHRTAHFMDHHVRREFERMSFSQTADAALSIEEKLGAAYVQERADLRDRHLEFYLAGAILLRSRRRVDLGAALEDALEYCAAFYLKEDRLALAEALRLVQRELLCHLHRVPGGRLDMAHRSQRRQQVDAFAKAQREIYFDRPRAKGVLDGFCHRIWGESDLVRCWIADGELVQPWPRVLRALAADRLAQAWHCEWSQGLSEARAEHPHDAGRADTELARDVLCQPLPSRGLRDAAGAVRRARVHWAPDLGPQGCGRPCLSALEALRPGDARARPLLGAHEVSQVFLRRLVAHVADTARLAVLLREPLLGDQESQLAIATNPRQKRALEPLTHSVELWPRFLRQVGTPRLLALAEEEGGDLLGALGEAGSPVPVASWVAAHRWLCRMHPGVVQDDYTLAAPPAALRALAAAIRKLPPPLRPSPVWDDREFLGKRRPPGCELQQPVAAATRLRLFQATDEDAWYASQALGAHFGPESRASAWQRLDQRKRAGQDLLARPCALLSRRLWVCDRGLAMTPWDDAGCLPEIFQRCDVRCPVVICPRASGRQLLGGFLPFGQYAPSEHARYVGDMGECILSGAEQQTLARAFRARGLSFLAVSMDRAAVLKQFLARGSVLYLLGRWAHFPLFLGEGRSSFPWLGQRWRAGILALQQLVRQHLRAELEALEPQLAPLREAWQQASRPPALWRQMAEPEALDCLRRRTGQPGLCVPELALRVECVQEAALRLAGAAVTPENLASALADASKTAGLLLFPTREHILGVCSSPLAQGGRLLPKRLAAWLEDPKIEHSLRSNTWPPLGGADPRPLPAQECAAEARPLQLGRHIVVMPDWAYYVRGFSERAGRGPRDAHVPWQCWALKGAPAQQHPAHSFWQSLRAAQREVPCGSRELVTIFGRDCPQLRARTRGGHRAEAEEGDPCWRPRDGASLEVAGKEALRKFLEAHPQYFSVSECADLRGVRGFRGASECIRAGELRRAATRCHRWSNLAGATWLHGTCPPFPSVACSAETAVAAEHQQLQLECAALELELERERQEARARTVTELAWERWPPGTEALPGLHGSRRPQEAQGPQEACVVLLAGRAAAFDRFAPALARAYVCVALHAASVNGPCYELTVASLRLLERQLRRLSGERAILLVGVGPFAEKFFADLVRLLEVSPDDAVPLPGEQPWPPPRHATFAQAAEGVGWCSLSQLTSVDEMQRLCGREDQRQLRRHWVALHTHWLTLQI